MSAEHAVGSTRIEALAPDIIRVRYSPDGRFPAERPWDVLIDLPPTYPDLIEKDDTVRLAAGALTAMLDCHRGVVEFSNDAGMRFAQDLEPPGTRDISGDETRIGHDIELPAGNGRRLVKLDKAMAADESYLGFGQRTGRLDRRHRCLTHWTIDHSYPGHSRGDDNLYQAHPFFMAVRPGFAWGLFMYSTWYSTFDVGAEKEDVLSLSTLGGVLDYFVFAGPTPAAVVEQLTRLTGRPALPPLWALGFHQSRWSYGSDAEVRAIARGFRERAIPLDAIHLDIDYMDGYRVFTWDKDRFANPAETVAELRSLGVRAVTIVDPGVKQETGYAVADEGLADGHFVRHPDGTPVVGYVWPGASLFPDFCRGATRDWWGRLHRALTDVGVDGVWCDMNEPSITERPHGPQRPMPLDTPQGGEASHAEVHNLYGHMMARATHEGLERVRPGRRPWVLTRSGYVGTQRWAASWMGDNSSWWEHLEMSLPQLASLGLSGSPHVGVDIGGFYHHGFDELFARWIALGAYYPFMRNHAHRDSRPQEPWAFGHEIETIARDAIALRYRLLPYLYTLAHRAHRTGEPILRPLVYDFPDDWMLHQVEDQVMIGPQLLVAPVYQPGVRRRLVELPAGTWYDLHTGARHDAGPLIADAPLARAPAFVRGGSVLTLGQLRQSTDEPLTELTLEAYPAEDESGHWTLTEDDGDSLDYREGVIAETRYTVAALNAGGGLAIGERTGRFEPHPRTLVVRLHLDAKPAGLKLDGKRCDWSWQDDRCVAELRLTDDGRAHRVTPVRG